MSFAQKTLISLFFFCLIFIIWGFPYGQWGFVNDDYIFLHYVKNTPWKNMLSFFYHGSPSNPDVIANAPIPKISFLAALYRPILSVLCKLQTSFFNLTPYLYKFVGIVIHSCITITLFNIFLTLFPVWLAMWGGLVFALHPSLWGWLGVFACQTYAYDLLFLLLSIFFLKKFIDTKNFIFYLFALLTSFIGMLNRETIIFIPPWIICFVYFYKENFVFKRLSLNKMLNAIKISIGFWLTSFSYFCVKLYLFPFLKTDTNISHTLSRNSFFTRQYERFFDVITYFCDFFGISLIQGNNRTIKGILLFTGLSLLITPFILRKRWPLLLFLGFSFFIFNWPSLLIVHHARYLYVTLPFFLIMLLFALNTYLSFFTKYKKIILCILYLLLIPLTGKLLYVQCKTAQSLAILTTAIQKLANTTNLNNKSIIFINLPMPWCGAGIDEGLKLYNPSWNNKTIYLKETFIPGISFLTDDHQPHKLTQNQEIQLKIQSSQQAELMYWNFSNHNFTQVNDNL